ncbi:MAG: hypothetical protein RIM99_14675 [Cyclobacteriaceae bacterium]
MKKVILLLGVLVAANILAAQDTLTVKEARGKNFKSRLGLTSEQEEQLKELRGKLRPELKSIREDDSKSRSEKLRALADVQEVKEKELSTILSGTQMAELKSIRSEVRENIRQRQSTWMKRRTDIRKNVRKRRRMRMEKRSEN